MKDPYPKNDRNSTEICISLENPKNALKPNQEWSWSPRIFPCMYAPNITEPYLIRSVCCHLMFARLCATFWLEYMHPRERPKTKHQKMPRKK